MKETIQRARKNALALLEALPAIGYRIAATPEPAEPDYPLVLRIEGALEYVHRHGGPKGRANPFGHPALAWVEDEEIDLPGRYLGGKPGRANYRPPTARTAGALEAAESKRGAPLALALDYLRHAFEWAGLPGWAGQPHAPERELAWLRGKLLPL